MPPTAETAGPGAGGRIRILAVASDSVVSDAGGGGSKRTWNLIRGFGHGELETTLWTVEHDTKEQDPPMLASDVLPEYRLPGRERRSLIDKLRALASPLPEEVWRRPVPIDGLESRLREFDVVVFMGPHATQLQPLARWLGLPVAIDNHDVVDEALGRIARILPGRVARWRTELDRRKWSRYERRMYAGASLVVAVSERDAAAVVRRGANRVAVRPNGVDISRYQYTDHSHPRHDRLLMTGHFGYHPNIDAARWLADEIIPRLQAVRPRLTLKLVGRHASDGPWPVGVTSERDVPEIQHYFDEADVLIVPLRAGGGTRLKLIEAFAKGLPVVSTTIGCEGLPVEHGVHLLIADTTDEIVAATLRLLGGPELRSRLARNARRLVEDRFDWRQISADYCADLRALAMDRLVRVTQSGR